MPPVRTPPPPDRRARGTPKTAVASRKRPADAARPEPKAARQRLHAKEDSAFEEVLPRGRSARRLHSEEKVDATGTEPAAPAPSAHAGPAALCLVVDALRLPLSVLQKVCLRMPHEMTRGNVVGAFLPSSLGVSTRVARPSDLRLLHERVAEHLPSQTPLRVTLRNAEGDCASCELPPSAAPPPPPAQPASAAPRAPISLVARAAMSMAPPPACGGSALLAQAVSLSSRPRACDPRPAANTRPVVDVH